MKMVTGNETVEPLVGRVLGLWLMELELGQELS